MRVRELAVRDVYEFTPQAFPDSRGLFAAPYQEEQFLKAVGFPLWVAQTSHSRSRRGTLRGLHYADVPPGQAKYIYCPAGALMDLVVDIRVGSPTFGRWDAVRLDGDSCRAVYLPEGVAHGFMALEDDTVMSYLCSTGYNPAAEHGISPLDPALGLPWPDGLEPVLSGKDADAPTLAQAQAAGALPSYDECVAHYERLRAASS